MFNGEWTTGVIGSAIWDLDDSPFSDFEEDLLSLLLGAIEEDFEKLEKESERDGLSRKSERDSVSKAYSLAI